jgi:excisionase family DNA binding protein
MYDPNEIITVEEVMEILKIGRNAMYKLLNSGEIPAFKIGRTWKITNGSIDNYIYKKIDDFHKKNDVAKPPYSE